MSVKLALALGTLFVALTHLIALPFAMPSPLSINWAGPADLNGRRIALIPTVAQQSPGAPSRCPDVDPASSPSTTPAPPAAGSLHYVEFDELGKTGEVPPSSRFCWRGATDGQIAWTAAPMPRLP